MGTSDKALNTGAKRVYDVAPSEKFAEFMKSGWAPTPLTGIVQPTRFSVGSASISE